MSSPDRPKSRRHFLRWSLRSLLLFFIPVCGVLTYYGHIHRQTSAWWGAINLMTSRGVDAHIANDPPHVTFIMF
jgi:hypothetical protein